ncbi:MAG TPA: ABC transporter ATP-binding protein, partial [Bacteroidales bacterium]|nr:ABC transporter ATP-binding protein [Bacteroidales bacterium]
MQANNSEIPLLSIRDLTVKFRSEKDWKAVVHGIDFEVFRGKTLGIVGESGSGKSVSSLALMGLLDDRNSKVSASAYSFSEVNLTGFSESDLRPLRGKRMAMIFQEPMSSLNPVQRCGRQVEEALRLHQKMNKAEAKKRVLALFKQVKLPRPEAMYRAYPHQLSGGQKQRVMIAMALSCNPDLLIADEPTTALDVTVQQEILVLLKDLKQQYGMGMIFITHDLGVIATVADELAVMYQGKI